MCKCMCACMYVCVCVRACVCVCVYVCVCDSVHKLIRNKTIEQMDGNHSLLLKQ